MPSHLTIDYRRKVDQARNTGPTIHHITAAISPIPWLSSIAVDFRILADCVVPPDKSAPKPVGLSGVKAIRMSAEHGTVTLVAPDSTVQVGDAFDFMVGYGDSTVFLHDNLYGIRDGLVEVVWPLQ